MSSSGNPRVNIMSSRVNTRVKTLSGAKPCVLSGNVAPGVAEVGSLFPRFRASIWESCRRKVHRTVSESSIFTPNCEQMHVRSTFGRCEVGIFFHETVARGRFAFQNVKKNLRPEHFWKMRSTKCAADFGQSSLSHKNLQKVRGSEQREIVPIISATRMLIDLVRRSCSTGCDRTH